VRLKFQVKKKSLIQKMRSHHLPIRIRIKIESMMMEKRKIRR